ncbi:MAG: hypothetical protein NZ772_03150 [Cyanobacteria bacterium]|nr:hypothetical protein [Cyanobacteriota bacterium]MDW8200031.1 hypothetical protein [Cyanobacteriota bacterium SKYGB_h_bin112]
MKHYPRLSTCRYLPGRSGSGKTKLGCPGDHGLAWHRAWEDDRLTNLSGNRRYYYVR